MKKISTIFSIILSLLYIASHAQEKEEIIVKAGARVLDYFSIDDRYLFPEFRMGRVLLKNNSYTQRMLNYNLLAGEIEFIDRSDTLSIRNTDDVKSVLIDGNTFYHDNGYIRVIKDGKPKVGLKEFYEIKEVQRKDPYGTTSQGSSTISYNMLAAQGNNYQLRANADMIFRKTKLYYISVYEDVFFHFSKKNVNQLYKEHKSEVKTFLKENNIKFDSNEDLMKLAEFLESL